MQTRCHVVFHNQMIEREDGVSLSYLVPLAEKGTSIAIVKTEQLGTDLEQALVNDALFFAAH